MAANFVIVVSILDGKNFPVRHDRYLLVEAKFDGEVMSTNPAPHVQQPVFRIELGWEVDKKGLQMHRLQHSPIKLQWYALDIDLSKKETIGYMILDIRLAQENLQSPKWYPLLNSKYQREKPEVQLLLYLDRVTEDVRVGTPSSRRSSIDKYSYKRPGIESRIPKHSPSKASSHSSSRIPVLKPALLPHSACYQLGPAELCSDMFNFSVMLTFAANLNKLQPPAMLKSSKGFYFYYSLFENDVMTENFSSLANPQFQPERASVKIRSSSKCLADYFEQNSNLEILLCCDEISLGSGMVSLAPLSCVSNRDVSQKPICIEGSVKIEPVDKTLRLGGDDLYPFVGVTVVLEAAKESNEATSDDTPVQTTILPHKSQPDLLPKMPQNSSGETLSRQSSGNKDDIRIVSPPTQENGASVPLVTDPSSASSSDTSPRDGGPFVQPPSSLSLGDSDGPVHFSFSLDLCHFMATRLSHPINLFIRYSYPFFGTTSSMITHPDIEVNQKRKISIPHGYCVFNFATTYARLKSTFWETPLLLEVLHRKKGGIEQLVGTARVNLFQVLGTQSVTHMVEKKTGMRQMTTSKVVVTSQEEYEIGEIDAVLTLISFGPTSMSCDHHHAVKSSNSYYNEAHNYIPNFPMAPSKQNGLIQDDRLQAALELELWQDRQREIFRAQLKDKEMQHLSVLCAEYKERDMEREILLRKQLQECRKLESKLKNTLKDAELKEKQLSSQEAELTRRLQDFDTQQERQQKEAKHKIETIKMECNELLAIERIKVRDYEQRNNHLKRQVQDLERDVQDQKKVIEKLKAQVNKDPDFHLRTEVNILNMEKAELQQKLEIALSSKQKYKLQWGQAVRQTSVLQQRLHALECAERDRREKIAAHQRILTEDKNVLKVNEEALHMIDEKVETLKSMLPAEIRKQQFRQMASAHISDRASMSDKDSQNSVNNKTNTVSTDSDAKSLPNASNGPTSEKSNNSAKSYCQSENNSVSPSTKSSSMIPKPISRDQNGNTPSKRVQSILSEKQNLLGIGYTEHHSAIKEFNTHLDKLAIK